MVVKTVEDALNVVGSFGRFQKLLLLIAGLLSIPNSVPNLVMYFAAKESSWHCVPNATDCTFNATRKSTDTFRCFIPRTSWEFSEPQGNSIVTEFDLVCERQLWVPVATSVFFVGYAISSVLFGLLADLFGRKKIIFICTAGIIISGTGASFAPNIHLIIALQFISGIFKGGTTTQAMVLTSEFVVKSKHKSIASMFILHCTVLSQIILGVTGYFVRNWRYLMLFTSAPYLIILLLAFFIPESIRWLILKGKDEKAVIILKRIGKVNGKDIHESDIYFPTFCQSAETNHRTERSFCNLFSTVKLTKLSMRMGFAWFVSGLSFYAITFAADALGGSMYENFLLVVAVELPAYTVGSLVSNRFGRKFPTIIFNNLGAVSCLLLVAAENCPAGTLRNVISIAVGLSGKFFMSATLIVQFSWAVELYPMHMRAEGMGFLVTIQTIGSACAPWVVEMMKVWHPSVPFIFVGVNLIISSFVQYFLLETHSKKGTTIDPA